MTSAPFPRTFTGPFCMLSAALLFTGMDLLVKVMGTGFRVWDIAFYRFAAGLVILFLFLARRHSLTTRSTRLLLVRGITGSIAFLLFIVTIRLIPISTAMVLFFSYPAFAAVFALFLYGERLGRTGMWRMAAALSGVAVILDFTASGTYLGQATGILAGVFAGFTIALIRRLRGENGSAVIYLYFCLVGTVITAVPFAAAPRLPLTGTEGLMVAGIIITSLGGQLLMNQGFKHCRSWEGGLYLTLEVPLASWAGIMLLGEPVNWRFWTGAFLIMGSLLLHQGETGPVLPPSRPGGTHALP